MYAVKPLDHHQVRQEVFEMELIADRKQRNGGGI
jgi:hypothetical protein